MLAHTGTTQDLSRKDFVYEMKLDGVRCIVYINSNGITLQSRSGKDITASFPEIVERLRPLRDLGYTMVLDGEIVAYDDDNELTSPPNFQKLQTRLQRKVDVAEAAIRVPARFVAFDCLQINGQDMLYTTPLDARRDFLVDIYRHHPSTFSLSPKHENGQTLFDYVTKFGYEGVIAKRKGSYYYPGTRSHDWLKIKPVKTATVYIGGYTYGVGRRERSLGALIAIEQMYAGWKFAGLVGTGLTDEQAEELRVKLDTLSMSPLPGDTWIPNDILRRAGKVGLTPIRAEVTYQERTKENVMRFPSFKRLV